MSLRSIPENGFKAALRSRRRQIGLWLGLANPYAAELCAGCGFDWLLIDGEHAPNDLRTTLATLQAVAAYPIHPVVRVPSGDATLIKQVLEIGATTLLVPMVESADQARELVRAMRYPPGGERGVGSGLARSSRWGRYQDYLSGANERVCLLAQVETVTALSRIEEIAAVEGVDGLFVGAADLAASMGYLGQPARAEVRQQVERAIRTITASGKAAGILSTDDVLARRYLELGASFVAVGIDTVLLERSASTLAAAFRMQSGTPPKGIPDHGY